jgi:hypothetical protein
MLHEMPRHLFFPVAQHFSGGLVDKMYPSAGRTGHGFVAIGVNSRRLVGQPYLNVQAGWGTSENEFGHFFILMVTAAARVDLPQTRRHGREGVCVPVDPPSGSAAMPRIKHLTIRNKINLADPAQVRAWTRRLNLSADSLKAVVDKAGNFVAAIAAKEVELRQAAQPNLPVPPPENLLAEGEFPVTA